MAERKVLEVRKYLTIRGFLKIHLIGSLLKRLTTSKNFQSFWDTFDSSKNFRLEIMFFWPKCNCRLQIVIQVTNFRLEKRFRDEL